MNAKHAKQSKWMDKMTTVFTLNAVQQTIAVDETASHDQVRGMPLQKSSILLGMLLLWVRCYF